MAYLQLKFSSQTDLRNRLNLQLSCPKGLRQLPFSTESGVSRDEIIGQNCRFLQGPGTDMTEVDKIKKAVEANPPETVSVTILNYKHDGTPFWNALHISPVRDADGRIAFFVGIQTNLNDPVDPSPLSSNVAMHRQRHHIPYCGKLGFKQQIQRDGTVGAVRIAVRSISGNACSLHRQPIQYRHNFGCSEDIKL